MAVKTLTATDLQKLSAAELEALQLAVNAEVAARIQNDRLEERLVTALTDAQSVGFTDAQIDTVFAKSRDRVKKGRIDPAKGRPSGAEPSKPGKAFNDPKPSVAKMKEQHIATE